MALETPKTWEIWVAKIREHHVTVTRRLYVAVPIRKSEETQPNNEEVYVV
jgi:hypothetical protein